MKIYEPEKAAEIWKRVQGVPEPDAHSLLGLIQEEWTDSALYIQLSRLIQGSSGRKLRQMAEQEQTHAACLTGIYTLITGSRPAVPAGPVKIGSIPAALRSCYGREMRCLARYEQRTADTEYGKVFAKLAQQEQEHCRLILEIIGTCKAGF